MSTQQQESAARTANRSWAPASDRPEAMVGELRRLVSRNAARWKGLALLEALGLAVAVPLGYLWIVFLLDNWLYLPSWGRLLAAAGFLVGVAWLGVRLLRRLSWLTLSEDEVALAIERQTPGGVQNRLINALQLARGAGANADALSPAVVRENYDTLRQTVLPQATTSRPALIRAGLALLLVGAGIAFWLLRPEHFTNAASRILLPLANIEPLYRTRLTVEPGNVEAEGDVPIRITIVGERPETLLITRMVNGQRLRESVAVPADATEVDYTFLAVRQSLTYQVQGGDYTTPVFRIDVPNRARLSLVRATLHFPEYTGRAPAVAERAGGDLEALRGTRGDLTFVFDQSVTDVVLHLERRVNGQDATIFEPIEPTSISPTEWNGGIAFEEVLSYELEVRQGDRPSERIGPFAIRVLADQDPKLELSGLDSQAETNIDAALPLRVRATDDFGLVKVGLFVRKMNEGEDWKEVVVWPADKKTEFTHTYELLLASLNATEGDALELAARAVDTDPAKQGAWISGQTHKLLVGGEGVALQRQYEQILRSEQGIKAVLGAQRTVSEKTVAEMRKLDPASGARWDDPKVVQAFHAVLAEHARGQEQLRQTAGRIARDMPVQSGNLRVGFGMLADTEMIRAIRILESIPAREGPQAKRAALADARLTQERTVRSLEEIQEQFVGFRQDWELANMIGFVEMLMDRQGRLRDQSRRHATQPPAEVLRASMQRRQAKLAELAKLASPAFAGMAERTRKIESILADAFQAASTNLLAEPLQARLTEAGERAAAGQWAEAAMAQDGAARELATIFASLKKAQADAAAKALEALKQKAQSDLEAQKALQKLQEGTDKTFLNLKDKMNLEDIIHMREIAAGKKDGGDRKPHVEDYLFPDSAVASLDTPDKGIRQQFELLKLADKPSGTPSFPKQSDRQGNALKNAPIQERLDDLVGKLLEEADEMNNKYETYNLNAAFNINEPGEIGKQGGDINSTAAAASTGNMKPPTSNVGGASRAGRRGARAHGMVVGDESINRRGRDKVQEGQEKVGDQAGTIREKKSDDMQKDTSTGVGGKKVEGDNEVKFSLEDAGKFTEDILKRLDKPQQKNFIVERKDGALDPRIAEMMRDLTNRQEQIIERVKALKKELRNLYLPTDHVDEALAQLTANLDALKNQPEPEMFRLQAQVLDQLRNTVRVFQSPTSGFQPSLPRERALHGRVLDEPARDALPGYEEAVKRYYEKLSVR